MWLFHSIQLADLNPKCLRHALLDYCLRPRTTAAYVHGLNIIELHKLAKDVKRNEVDPPTPFDSWFEIDVFLRIHSRGLTVIPQFEIAGRRIDLVIELSNRKFAIECDGDHWHGPEHYAADLARQRDLERCNLQFWRVRESAFYLDPEKAMQGLWDFLSENTPQAQPLSPTPLVDLPEPASIPDTNSNAPKNDVILEIEESEDSDRSVPQPKDDDLLKAPIEEVVQELQEILQKNGPMGARCAYRLVCRNRGIHRLGSRIESFLSKCVTRAAKSGALEVKDEWNRREIADRFLFLSTQIAVVHERNARDLEDIPPSEIATLIGALKESHPKISKEGILKLVSQHYGFERLRGSLLKHLEKIWDRSPGEGSSGSERSEQNQSSPNLPPPLNDPSLEIIDKRASNGCLWIIDGPKFRSLIPQLKVQGLIFSFAEKGGAATDRKPAWWIKKI
jgi:hypothetical protein